MNEWKAESSNGWAVVSFEGYNDRTDIQIGDSRDPFSCWAATELAKLLNRKSMPKSFKAFSED